MSAAARAAPRSRPRLSAPLASNRSAGTAAHCLDGGQRPAASHHRARARPRTPAAHRGHDRRRPRPLDPIDRSLSLSALPRAGRCAAAVPRLRRPRAIPDRGVSVVDERGLEDGGPGPPPAAATPARAARHLPDAWEQAYGTRPLLLETLVDAQRFRGTCYRAANWLLLGDTHGRGRMDRQHARHGAAPKRVFVYPLIDDVPHRLCQTTATLTRSCAGRGR